MNLLAPPPRPAVQLETPPPFFGRSLAEYAECFDLDVAALRDRDVLDVAAGASSFVAEACARRVDAVAIDPVYGCAVDELTSRVEAASARPPSRLSRIGGRAAATTSDRQAAAQRFLNDYATQWLYGRYVGGSLPHLPFFDGTFDLVLCAHLLFAQSDRYDFDWHLAACRELVRVSAGEARVHSVTGPDGKLYAGLPRLRRELKALGIGSELVAVRGEFVARGSATLVLRRIAP